MTRPKGAERALEAFAGFGAALQALRAQAAMSRADLQRASGLSASSLASYEAERSLPRIDKLDAILSGLGMDVLDLALALYREGAKAISRERPLFERPDLLAGPGGRQVLDHARTLYFMGEFWIDSALTLLPAARAEAPARDGGDGGASRPTGEAGGADAETTEDAGDR